jgi:hypothetical protein
MTDETAWHLDKKIPISLIGAIAVQTFGFGFWAATLNARVGYLEQNAPSNIAEFAKLESARENTNLALNTLQSDVKALLELARRNETRNVVKDNADQQNK